MRANRRLQSSPNTSSIRPIVFIAGEDYPAFSQNNNKLRLRMALKARPLNRTVQPRLWTGTLSKTRPHTTVLKSTRDSAEPLFNVRARWETDRCASQLQAGTLERVGWLMGEEANER